jgi:hypothetical protein
MPTLTDEGWALIGRVADAGLRANLYRWLSRVQIMEEGFDELVADSMTHAQAVAEPPPNVSLLRPLRPVGNGGVGG